MCGIVGVAGFIDKAAKEAFDDLLWIDAIRGRDGTGIVAVNHQQIAGIVKSAYDVGWLRSMPEYRDALLADNIVLLGHNRSLTSGNTDKADLDADAHPFSFGSVVGVHNGSLSNRSKRALEDGEGLCRTDSQALYRFLSKNPIKEVLSRVEGGTALVWYDTSDNTINLYRNKERPLFYAVTDAQNTLFWASEIAFLYTALNRKHIQFASKNVHSVPENTHLKFSVPMKEKAFVPKPVKVVLPSASFFLRGATKKGDKLVPMTMKEYLSQTGPGGRPPGGPRVFTNNTGVKEGSNGVFTIQDCGPGASCATDIMKPGADVLPFARPATGKSSTANANLKMEMSRLIIPAGMQGNAYYMAPWGKVEQPEFDKLVANGCQYCSANDIQWGEPIKFLSDHTYICSICMTTGESELLETLMPLM